jgi:Uma2 family endonuclease
MNIHVTRAGEGLDRRAFTVDEIFRMVEAGIIDEDERIELIDGEIIAMSPKHNAHEIIKNGMLRSIMRAAPAAVFVGAETTIYFNDTSFLEPDIVMYPSQMLPLEVRAKDVLLIIEVAETSLSYDKGRKAKLYAELGVAELWVIDAVRKTTRVHRAPLDGEWSSVENLPTAAPLSHPSLPGWIARLSDIQ